MTTSAVRVLVVEQARGVWGAQRYLLRLAPLLREYGVELTLAGPEVLELHRDWRDAGYQSIYLDIPLDRSIRTAGRPTVGGLAREGRTAVSVARRIAKVARDGDYDAIWANAHWTHLETSLAGWMCGKPVVLHLHEEAMPGIGRWLRATAVSIATRAVAVSAAVAAGLPRMVGHRATVISNGVDTQLMSPTIDQDRVELRKSLGFDADDVMVLAATRLDPTKRIEDLIACVAELGGTGVRLVIAGETSTYPEYESSVRALARELPPEMVTFCGNRTDMAHLFLACDIVLHAGTVEGMPLTVVEAQACGKPVIAYDVAGVAEALVDGETGVLVPPMDVNGLTTALQALVATPTRRAVMGSRARAHALAHHDISVQARRNAAVLLEICGRRSAPKG